ncbi:U11/U12 small nuclear ribonucleoprotein 48 kDa protein-like [Galleria mellonella]|uniref:U11/U12 small nuclear ribonucleoprotein 48 kDa protein-like n=1 Tax=Galleria mellonella TaxID=7137 RepID=A0ABM3MMJ6_GALME|nr:U11/U12 small nuclear ribonucleoprotein 48 kDa protein-like [Galleria mellonella]
MEIRQKQLLDLKLYVENVEAEVTMILQSLQWDRKSLLEKGSMVSCKFDNNHRVPTERKEEHEKQCLLRHLGYSKEDVLLPDPSDITSNTVTFGKYDIQEILNAASHTDPLFRKGSGCDGCEPLTLARLQTVYSADERRAIYDAVVKAAPSCHDLADLALPSSSEGEGSKPSGAKSRLEVLAELRDMKRRRTKYRVAAKTRNYSDVLRDVIRTQMETYTEVSGAAIKATITTKANANIERKSDNSNKLEKYKSEDVYYKHERKRDVRRYNEDENASKQNRLENKRHDRDRERKENERDSYRDRSKCDDTRSYDHRKRYDNGSEKKYYHTDEKYKQSTTTHEDNKYYRESSRKKDREETYYRSYKDRDSRDSREYDKSDYKCSRHSTSKSNLKRYYDVNKEVESHYSEKIKRRN